MDIYIYIICMYELHRNNLYNLDGVMTLRVIIFISKAIENLSKILTPGMKISFHFVEQGCPRQLLFNIGYCFAFSYLPEVQGKILFLMIPHTLDIEFGGLKQHLN